MDRRWTLTIIIQQETSQNYLSVRNPVWIVDQKVEGKVIDKADTPRSYMVESPNGKLKKQLPPEGPIIAHPKLLILVKPFLEKKRPAKHYAVTTTSLHNSVLKSHYTENIILLNIITSDAVYVCLTIRFSLIPLEVLICHDVLGSRKYLYSNLIELFNRVVGITIIEYPPTAVNVILHICFQNITNVQIKSPCIKSIFTLKNKNRHSSHIVYQGDSSCGENYCTSERQCETLKQELLNTMICHTTLNQRDT